VSEALELALAAAGIDVRVESRDRLAILTPRAGAQGLTSEPQRRLAIALATQRGFTHVALELLD
jgi:hypothetical protein